MTRGIRTSEFWIVVATVLVHYLSKTGLVPDMPQDAMIAVIAYVLSRGLAKLGKGVSNETPKAPSSPTQSA